MLRAPLSLTIAAIESFLEPRERPGVMLRPCDLVIAAPTAAEGFRVVLGVADASFPLLSRYMYWTQQRPQQPG